MSDGLIVSALVIAVLVGVTGAAFLVMRSPAFWADAGKQLFSAMLPEITRILTKRMPPDEEAEYRRAVLQGRGDEWLKDRMQRRKRKR